jgi:hypothetical protein
MDAFAKWFARTHPDAWLFDVDDDTLVLPDRLLAFLPTSAEYVGWGLDFDDIRYASGGAGTMLSPRAVGVLAERGIPLAKWHDDHQLGEVLLSAGIKLTEDERFRPWRNSDPSDGNEPTRENEFITCHCKSPGTDPNEDRIALMRKLWAEVA